jgi:hypothetical protein
MGKKGVNYSLDLLKNSTNFKEKSNLDDVLPIEIGDYPERTPQYKPIL